MSEPRPPPLHPGGWLSYGDASPTTPVPYWREFLAGVYLIGANFSRARARRSRATRSASRPTRSSRLGGASPISFSTVLLRDFPSDVGQPSDPQSDRPAGAACWPPSPVPEFGLGLVRPPRRRIRWCGRRRRASAARYGVDFDTTPIEAALIGQWRVPPLYPLTARTRSTARPAGAATWPPSPIPFSLNSVRGRGDRCVGQRSDPLGPPGRRFANFFFEQFFFEIFRFWGERWSSGVRGGCR